MIFFVANDGTVIASEPSSVYQGAADTNNIYLVAPFAEGLQAAVAFKLPNGVYTTRYPMSEPQYLPGIVDKQSGRTYKCWQYSMPNGITQYYGTVTAQFFFYPEEGGVITPTSSVSFVVGKGVPSIKPTAPGDDVFDAIMSNLSELSKQLNNGEFAARAIYQWNSAYTYGAGEITYYPLGDYGAFIKSLVDNNQAEPYVNGQLNGAAWQNVTDLNILNDLYGLKGELEEGVQSAQSNAATAVQSATAAQNSATTALTAAASLKDNAEYIESVKSGNQAVPKAVSDESGGNIANQFASVNSDIEGLREDISNEAHFRGMFDSAAALKAAYPTATPNDYAYIVGGNIWIYGKNGWTDSGEPSPNTSVPASNATPLMDGAASAGSLSQYARGDHRHPGDTTKANTTGDYPNMTVGAATNDGTGRNIAETANKNLYNLGAYDTYVSNGNGTGTVTRRTLLITKDNIISYGLNGSAPYQNFHIISNVLKASTGKVVGKGDFIGYYDFNKADGTLSFNGKAPMTNLQLNEIIQNIVIEAEADEVHTYTKKVIENQPIHIANQEECLYWHEEWRKSLNLADYNNLLSGGISLEKCIEGNTYTFSTTLDVSRISEIKISTSAGGVVIATVYGKQALTFTMTQQMVGKAIFIVEKDTYNNLTAEANYDYMLNEGTHPYPYEPYNCGIVREKTLEEYLPKTGGTVNGSLNVSDEITENGKRVYSDNNPPPLYVHYFNFHYGGGAAGGISFTILSRKQELLTNAEILSLLPDNSNPFNNIVGITANGLAMRDSILYIIEKLYKYNNKLSIGGWNVNHSAFFRGEITENLASATHQKVLPLY